MSVAGEIWEVKVVGSAMDMVHGFYNTIKELYIPEYNICFNVTTAGAWHCFKPHEERYENDGKKIEDVVVSNHILSLLLDHIKSQEKMGEVEEWFTNLLPSE